MSANADSTMEIVESAEATPTLPAQPEEEPMLTDEAVAAAPEAPMACELPPTTAPEALAPLPPQVEPLPLQGAPPLESLLTVPAIPTTPALATSTPVVTPIRQPVYPVNNVDSNQRRSSRSIRRRRFDDEIVESSLGRSFSLTPSGPKSATKATPTPSTPQTPSAFTPSSSLASPPPTPSNVVPPSPGTPASTSSHVPAPIASSDRKRPSKGGSHKKRAKLKQSATKDLGRWKPTDDLALIIGVMQTSDLKVVHTGVKFSCRFTFSEVQGRFWALMYDPAVNRVAMAAMRNLHPEMVAAVKHRALFSSAEEILLARIPANSQPDLDVFQKLLDENATVFYESRTSKILNNHWLLMRQYHLLPDQTNQGSQRPDQTVSLSDTEDLMRDGDLTEPKDEALCHEMSLADRALQRQVNRLEAETKQWSVAVEHVTGIGPVDFDNQTLAVLRGRFVRYLMRSREITIGRTTKDLIVDVDLSLEGPAYKVSRRQGTIRLRNNGDFFLVCEGRRAIMVDGKPLLTGKKTRLNNNSVLEIATLRFTFLVNQELISVIRQEAAKMNLQPLASTPQRV